MNKKRGRKLPRLQGYDYSFPGIYFVTICTHKRKCLFGRVSAGQMYLNPIGQIVQDAWKELPDHYLGIKVEPFVIMPNHVHGLIELKDVDGRGGFLNPPLQQAHGLSEIIRGFKTWSARRINETLQTSGTPLWQRSYYDKIIRNEEQLQAITDYIQLNPLNWEKDEDNIG